MNALIRTRLRLAAVPLCTLVACGGPDAGGAPSHASFSVVGRWIGTATDDDSTLELVLDLANDGGNSTELAGTLELEGVGPLPFEGGFIDTSAGASRVFGIEAEDDDGYLYELRGSFTSKRVDDGQLESSNPALDVDLVFLEVTLLKE